MSVEMVAAVLRLSGCTPYEKLVLLALAEDCRRGTRLASPGLDDDAASPGMLTRTGLGRSRLLEVVKQLRAPVELDGREVRPSLLRSVSRAQKYRRAVYELLIEPYASDAERGQRPPAPDADAARITAQGPPPPDAEPPVRGSQRPARRSQRPGNGSQRSDGADASQYLPELPPSLRAPVREEAAVIVDPEETREAPDETFGTRTLPLLARDDLTATTLDRLHHKVARRIGLGPAADAVRALCEPRISSPLAYLESLDDDELRDLADRARHERERRGRAERPERPPWCGDCHEHTRRLEHPDHARDLGPCPACSPRRRAA